jgi:hypothetical protein
VDSSNGTQNERDAAGERPRASVMKLAESIRKIQDSARQAAS